MRLLRFAGLAIGSWIAAAGPNYRIYVASESGDIISQLTADGTALRTTKQVLMTDMGHGGGRRAGPGVPDARRVHADLRLALAR